MIADENFEALRRCMREPIKEIFDAAQLLSRATDAHLLGTLPLLTLCSGQRTCRLMYTGC
jgi:hypothetical protein